MSVPICKSLSMKSSDTDSEIQSQITKLRIKSSSGDRATGFWAGSNSRQKSVAVLRRLTQSLSSRVGLGSPFRDSLRERWLQISRDYDTYNDTAEENTLPSSAKGVRSLESNKENILTYSMNSSRCNSSKTPRTGNSRASLVTKDWKDRQSGPSSAKDVSQKNRQSQTTTAKDLGELTHRSETDFSVKDSNSANKRRVSAKRWQSAGSMALKSNGNNTSAHTNPRKEVIGVSKREVTSPRIITINRVPTPTMENEVKSKPLDKGDSRTKYVPQTAVCSTSSQAILRTQDQVLHTPCAISKGVTNAEQNGNIKAVTSSTDATSTSKTGTCISHRDCTVPIADLTVSEKEGTQSEMNALRSQQVAVNTSENKNVGSARTSLKNVDNSASAQQASPSQGGNISRFMPQENLTAVMPAHLGFSHQHFGQSAICLVGQTVDGTDFGLPTSENASQPSAGPCRSVFMETAKPQTICVPFISADASDSDSSSSTGTVPLSSTHGTYVSGEGAGSSTHPGCSQGVAGGDVGGWDHRSNDQQKLKELGHHGNSHARPLSRNSVSKKTLSLDKVAFEREDPRPLANSVSASKQVPLRANGFKNNLLRADQYLSQRSHGATGGEEDLVTMGTLWTPNNQTRGSSTITSSTITTTVATAVSSAISTSSSSKSISASLSGNGSSGSGGGVFTTPSCTLPPRRPGPGGTTTTWHALHHSSCLVAPTMGNAIRSTKEADPKYGDPVTGAPPTFQQRLMELAALEAETLRWERGKKVKKKPPKHERDS